VAEIEPDATTNRWMGWLAALVLGIVMGVAMLELGVIGVALTALSLALIWRKGPRLLGLAGFICGFAGTWGLLFWNVVARCDVAQLPAGETCTSGITGAYLVGAGVALALGVGLTAAEVRRRGRQG
jgi:hypothetical protein